MKRIFLLASLVVATAGPLARADLLAPNQPINGISQAELSARWWTWGVSYPASGNPISDTTGASSHLGRDQTPVAHPGVFYLAGNFGTPTSRTATVRENETLFFPLINSTFWLPEDGPNEAVLRVLAADVPLGLVPGSLFLKINGQDVPLPGGTTSLADFRQISPPGLFPIVLSDVFDPPYPPGLRQAVSDGFWVALDPLPPGTYTLEFGGATSAFGGFSQQQTYVLQVITVPEPATALLLGIGFAGVAGWRWRKRRAG